jgi:hypothetical protein
MPHSEEIAEIKNKLDELEKIQKELVAFMMLICFIIFKFLMNKDN